MRQFNKLFVVALPRCATVSISHALGILGVPTAHLGKIYDERREEHCDPARLKRIYEQLSQSDYDLDILRECRGLADYPVCCMQVIRCMDRQYPNSLFVNARRDYSITSWLQSVERQFVGLELLKSGKESTAQEKEFMQVMLRFREMTFGQHQFDRETYRTAYSNYQRELNAYFQSRPADFLEFIDVAELQTSGFHRLAEFLEIEAPDCEFPRNNSHSAAPTRAFLHALASGAITSQTGIQCEVG